MTSLPVAVLKTLGELQAARKDLEKEYLPVVKNLMGHGYEFILCWNFGKKVMTRFQKAEGMDIRKCPSEFKEDVMRVRDSVYNIYVEEDFGKELMLVVLKPGSTIRDMDSGRKYPTMKAQKALAFLNIIPVKQIFKAQHFTTRKEDRETIVSYKFAEAHEVVPFM